jgi:hypothetical protein
MKPMMIRSLAPGRPGADKLVPGTNAGRATPAAAAACLKKSRRLTTRARVMEANSLGMYEKRMDAYRPSYVRTDGEATR